jgi:hypothetical protein
MRTMKRGTGIQRGEEVLAMWWYERKRKGVRMGRTSDDIARKVSTSDISLCNPDSPFGIVRSSCTFSNSVNDDWHEIL